MDRVLFFKDDFVFRTMSPTDIEPLCDLISTQHAQNHSMAFSYNYNPELIRPYVQGILENKTIYQHSIVAVHRPTGEICGCIIASDYEKLQVKSQGLNDKIRPYTRLIDYLLKEIFKKSGLNPRECFYIGNFIVHRKFKGQGLGFAIIQAYLLSQKGTKHKHTVYSMSGNGSRGLQFQFGVDKIIDTYEVRNFEENGTRPFKDCDIVMILSSFSVPSPKL